MGFDNSRVLITGGAGFIGANLARSLLERGAEVTVIDDFSAGSMSNLKDVASDMTVIKGDVRNIAAVKKAIEDKDFVFHMAANASVPVSIENPWQDFEVNAIGTLNVLEALRDMDSGAPFVFASSAAVYGEQGLVPTSEDSQLKPLSPYGASKLAGEIICQTFHRIYGLPTVCLRFFNVYGPLQRKYVMFDIMNKLQKRRDTLEVLGTGDQIRDFTYVSDAVDACLLLAKTPSAIGEIYNVGTGVETTIRELVGLILELYGLQRQIEVLYTGKSWKGDVQRFLADIEKIRELGFQPKIELKTGLVRFVDWYNVSYLPDQRNIRCE